MFVKSIFVLFLIAFAYALPQDTGADAAAAPTTVNWINNFHHQPIEGVKEGDKLTITYDPVTDPAVLAQCANIKSWTIGIGRGTGKVVKEQLFMESERFIGVPTEKGSYTFQLPAQMENDQYCIQYTPFASEQGTDRATNANGQQLEALYEIWFPITGSLQIGQGPATAVNSFTNTQPAAAAASGVAGTPAMSTNVTGATNTLTPQNESGSNILTPTITAFIAVLFACLFF